MQRKLKSIMKLISRRILDRIIDINPSIPGMLIINLIYLILGEIIIIALVPNTMRCAIGFLAGDIFGICNISYEQWNTKDSIWWCRVKSNYDYWLSYPSFGYAYIIRTVIFP